MRIKPGQIVAFLITVLGVLLIWIAYILKKIDLDYTVAITILIAGNTILMWDEL